MAKRKQTNRKERGTYLGGHHASAIVGAHPYLSAADVYREIVEGQRENISDRPWIRRGAIIEPGLLDWVEREIGLAPGTMMRDQFIVDPEYDFLAGTLDGITPDECVIEVTSTTSKSSLWGSQPASYKVDQAQWYMMLAGMRRARIVVMLADTGEIREWQIGRDDERIALLRTAAIGWWERHVIRREPLPEQSPEVEPEGEIEAGEFDDLISELIEWQAKQKLCEESVREIRDQLQTEIEQRNAKRMRGQRATVSIVTSTRCKTAWDRIAYEMQIPQSTIEAHTTTTTTRFVATRETKR